MNNKTLTIIFLPIVLGSCISLTYLWIFTSYTVGHGSSMSPTFSSQGETTFFSKTLDANLTNKIIYVRLPYDPYNPSIQPLYYCHRVVSDNGTAIITKGDNPLTNPLPDPWIVSRSEIVGEVFAYIPLWEWNLIQILLIVIAIASGITLVIMLNQKA